MASRRTATVAALLARAPRPTATAHARCLQTPQQLPVADSAQAAAAASLAWRGSAHAPIELLNQSPAVFRELQPWPPNDTQTTRQDEIRSVHGIVASSASTDFRANLENKKKWMDELADGGAFDALLRVVYECYEPLYKNHPRLRGTSCSLWESYDDISAVATFKSRYRLPRFNDLATRNTEVKAMELFVTQNRPELATAVFQHRKFLATRVGTVVDRKSHITTDFGKHFTAFSSWAMSAFQAKQEYPQAVAVYVKALANGVVPTATMTAACLASLLSMGDFAAVEALYEETAKHNRPVDRHFHRQMLYFAGLTHHSAIMQQTREEMKSERIPLRVVDFLSAMRALDSQYFQSVPTKEPRAHLESYKECVQRIADQASAPETLAHSASTLVLELFDEMIHTHKIVPQHKDFFPRVIKAAMLLENYPQVAQYVALHERVFGGPLSGNTSLVMATNAQLLQDNPKAAWDLVIKVYTAARDAKPTNKADKSPASSGVLASLGCIVEYFAAHHKTKQTMKFLNALKAKKLLFLFKRDHRRTLIDALVGDTRKVSDAAILEMLRQYAVAFSVRTKASSLGDFAKACIKADRWALLVQVLKTRDTDRIPTIPMWLAVDLSTRALEDTANADRMELAVEVAKMVDHLEALGTSADRLLLGSNAVRALEVLRDHHGDASGLYYEREISLLRELLLLDKVETIPSVVPQQDTRAMTTNPRV